MEPTIGGTLERVPVEAMDGMMLKMSYRSLAALSMTSSYWHEQVTKFLLSREFYPAMRKRREFWKNLGKMCSIVALHSRNEQEKYLIIQEITISLMDEFYDDNPNMVNTVTAAVKEFCTAQRDPNEQKLRSQHLFNFVFTSSDTPQEIAIVSQYFDPETTCEMVLTNKALYQLHHVDSFPYFFVELFRRMVQITRRDVLKLTLLLICMSAPMNDEQNFIDLNYFTNLVVDTAFDDEYLNEITVFFRTLKKHAANAEESNLFEEIFRCFMRTLSIRITQANILAMEPLLIPWIVEEHFAVNILFHATELMNKGEMEDIELAELAEGIEEARRIDREKRRDLMKMLAQAVVRKADDVLIIDPVDDLEEPEDNPFLDVFRDVAEEVEEVDEVDENLPEF